MLVTRDPASLVPPPRSGAVAGLAAETAARFEASRDVRWRLDPRAPLSQYEARGPLKIEVRLEGPAPGLVLRCTNATDAVLLPAFAPLSGQDLALRLEIDSSIATEAELSYQSGASESWSAAGSVKLALAPGLNLRWLTLPASARVGRLCLRPGQSAGRSFVLRSLEVRAVH